MAYQNIKYYLYLYNMGSISSPNISQPTGGPFITKLKLLSFFRVWRYFGCPPFHPSFWYTSQGGPKVTSFLSSYRGPKYLYLFRGGSKNLQMCFAIWVSIGVKKNGFPGVVKETIKSTKFTWWFQPLWNILVSKIGSFLPGRDELKLITNSTLKYAVYNSNTGYTQGGPLRSL